MNKLKALLLTATLTGCAGSVPIEAAAEAEKVCSQFGGAAHFKVELFNERTWSLETTCNNNFFVKSKFPVKS